MKGNRVIPDVQYLQTTEAKAIGKGVERMTKAGDYKKLAESQAITSTTPEPGNAGIVYALLAINETLEHIYSDINRIEMILNGISLDLSQIKEK